MDSLDAKHCRRRLIYLKLTAKKSGETRRSSHAYNIMSESCGMMYIVIPVHRNHPTRIFRRAYDRKASTVEQTSYTNKIHIGCSLRLPENHRSTYSRCIRSKSCNGPISEIIEVWLKYYTQNMRYHDQNLATTKKRVHQSSDRLRSPTCDSHHLGTISITVPSEPWVNGVTLPNLETLSQDRQKVLDIKLKYWLRWSNWKNTKLASRLRSRLTDITSTRYTVDNNYH